jgi:hypothetical protein
MTQKYARDPNNYKKLGFPKSVNKDYRLLLADSLIYYFKILDDDINKGIKELLEVDKYSVYSYLKRYLFRRVSYEEDIDQTIGAMEMTEAATGLFRISFVEAVMDAYTFLHHNQEWKTIKYGMQRFPNAFKPILDTKKHYIKYDRKVFKLKNENDGKLRVYWKEKHGTNEEHEENKVYDRVIVTCPFGVVRQWELPG